MNSLSISRFVLGLLIAAGLLLQAQSVPRRRTPQQRTATMSYLVYHDPHFDLYYPSTFHFEEDAKRPQDVAFVSPDQHMWVAVTTLSPGRTVPSEYQRLVTNITGRGGKITGQKLADDGFWLTWDNPATGFSGVSLEMIGKTMQVNLAAFFDRDHKRGIVSASCSYPAVYQVATLRVWRLASNRRRTICRA
jgi:hypothetical protein